MIIKTSEVSNYKFKASKEEEIKQNILNIISRVRGNIVLNREKGLSLENIDKPINILKAELIADITEEIEEEEPRFKINEINILSDQIILDKLNVEIEGEIK